MKSTGTFVLRYRVANMFWGSEGNKRPIVADSWGGPFEVYSANLFPGLQASTELTKVRGSAALSYDWKTDHLEQLTGAVEVGCSGERQGKRTEEEESRTSEGGHYETSGEGSKPQIRSQWCAYARSSGSLRAMLALFLYAVCPLSSRPKYEFIARGGVQRHIRTMLIRRCLKAHPSVY